MKKIIGKISWIIVIIAAGMIALAITIFDNYILFYSGVGLLVMGSIGTLLTGKKTIDQILNFLDFI